MKNVRSIGLDVHEGSITIAVAEPDGSAPMVLRRIEHDMGELLKTLQELGRRKPIEVAYEAGSTGFALQRRLLGAGIRCIVVAPSKVPGGTGQKTDELDAVRLARFLRSDDLKGIYVPDEKTEALRELTRAREDALTSQQMLRGQLRSFLVRHGRHFTEKSKWTKRHLDWIHGQKFELPELALTRDDYLREVEAAAARVNRLTKEIEQLAGQSPLLPVITALQSLRGVALVTAVTLAVEIGDFRRFQKPKQLMSFLGLVPREHSSGDRTRRGSITKAGNSHARRVLGETAWNCRFSRTSRAIEKRRAVCSPAVREIAQKAELRLSERFSLLMNRRKETNKICIAIAREMAGFIWAIGHQVAQEAKR